MQAANNDSSKAADEANALLLRNAAAAAAAVAEGERPVTPIAPGCGKGARPSRKREAALALSNLRKRVEASQLSRGLDPSPSAALPALPPLAARPHALLHKILSNRPLSFSANEWQELDTDWEHSEFISECLDWHNAFRARHGAPPVALCPQLCAHAQAWANHLAHTNNFYYRGDRHVSQNLFCRQTAPGFQTDVTGQEVASYWYSACRQYNYDKETDVLHANVNAGHFTQMVWVSTRWVGLGKARSRAGKVLVVAQYRPTGNVSGAFKDNVLPPVPDDEPCSSGESETSRSTGDLR